MTLEGREAFYNDTSFARDELMELSYTMKAECNRMMRAENPSQDEVDIAGMLHELPDLIKAESATQTSTTGNWEESGGNGGGGQDTPFGGGSKISDGTEAPSNSDEVAAKEFPDTKDSLQQQPEPAGKDPEVLFQADPRGRQYKIDPHFNRRIGNYGRKAKSGLASIARKPLYMDQSAWDKLKRLWL